MNLQVLCGLVVFLDAAFGKPSGGCQGPVFKVNGVNYTRELLKKNIEYPESLNYDRSTNSLYMTHHDDAFLYTVLAARMNLDTNDLETIGGVKGVWLVRVDAKTNKVYIQGEDGIYKYDKDTNKSELYVANNYNTAFITHLAFVKDDIVYFWAIPPWTMYKVVNGEISKVKELETITATSLFIDDYDNMFFQNMSGIFRQKIGSQEAVYYKDSQGVSFYNFAANKAGDVYFHTIAGIYTLSKDTNEMVEVLNVTANGFTFDGDDNIIYSETEKLYRLKPINDSNCV